MYRKIYALLISTVLSSPLLAAVQIKNVKTGQYLNPTVFMATEGFVALDKINTVYGVEIILKDLELPANYRLVNSDSPEQDFSFLEKYDLNKSEASADMASETTKAEAVSETSTAGTDLINTAVQAPQIRIVTGAAKTFIKDNAGIDLYVIEWTTERKGLVVRNCPTELLRLREIKNLQLSSPMGISCQLNMTPSLVTISPLKDVRWTSTNLVEVSGKGERYRTFEIPVGNLTGQVSGVFRMTAEGKNLVFAVYVKKIEEKVSTLSIGFDKRFSFGMNSATIAGPASSFASSSFFYEFYGLTDYIFSNYKFGFGFFNSFSTGEDPSIVSSRDSTMNAGYYSNSKGNFNWGAWLGHKNFDLKQDLSSTKFQSSQFAVGAQAHYNISSSQNILLSFEMASLGSKVVQSHMKIAVNYNFKLIFGKTEYDTGALFENQAMKLAAPDGSSRDYGLTKFGLSLGF